MASGGQVAWLVRCLPALVGVQALTVLLVLHAEQQSCARTGERQTVAFHFNGRSQRCTCAMDVTKAGVAAVCERVHRSKVEA